MAPKVVPKVVPKDDIEVEIGDKSKSKDDIEVEIEDEHKVQTKENARRKFAPLNDSSKKVEDRAKSLADKTAKMIKPKHNYTIKKINEDKDEEVEVLPKITKYNAGRLSTFLTNRYFGKFKN